LAAFFAAISFRMPSATLQGEGGAGDQFRHLAAAFGTFLDRLVGKLPAQFKPVATRIALILIDWHL
jgi:hypothetical protein